MGNLDGQVAIVTGGGRGLGRSISLALAKQGASVVIDDLFLDESGVSAAEQTLRDIEGDGGTGLALQEDVTTISGAEAMVGATIDCFHRVDALVMCAGNTVRGALQDLAPEQWDSLMSVHLRGHFLSCKAALPHMLRANYGRIVTVSSRGAFFQVPANKQLPRSSRRPPSTPYSAAKAGILGLTTTLAVELWETGITVNSLMPSATTQLFPETSPRLVGGLPASESLDPDDVAPTVVYLCSPASADVSGKLVYASGGDVVVFGDQLDSRASKMVRKRGRWTQEELSSLFPALVAVEGA